MVPIFKLLGDYWGIHGDEYNILLENLRYFLASKIIQPLATQIDVINAELLKNIKTYPLSIGKTPIADLEKICSEFQSGTMLRLPYVLAYLRLHPNYQHLVKRILTWAESDVLFDFHSESDMKEERSKLILENYFIIIMFCF